MWYANVERARVAQAAATVTVDGWYPIRFTETQADRLFDEQDLALVCGLPAVTWAVGLVPAEDFTLPGSGLSIPVRTVSGCRLSALSPALAPADGSGPSAVVRRFPFSDLAAQSVTLIQGADRAVQLRGVPDLPVGVIGSAATDAVLVTPLVPSATGAEYLTLVVGASSLNDAIALGAAIPRLLRGDDFGTIVRTPGPGANEAQQVLLAGFDRSAAQAVVGIVAASSALSSGALLIASRSRARDYARRRVLGCGRLPLAASVVAEVMLASLLGNLLSSVFVIPALLIQNAWYLPADIVVFLAAVHTGLAGLFCTPVALWVGYRDPVLVLRVP